MSGEHLDLASEPGGPTQDPAPRRHLGVHFACCGVYTRIYVAADESAYRGRCPRCLRLVTIQIGPAGTHVRQFTAY